MTQNRGPGGQPLFADISFFCPSAGTLCANFRDNHHHHYNHDNYKSSVGVLLKKWNIRNLNVISTWWILGCWEFIGEKFTVRNYLSGSHFYGDWGCCGERVPGGVDTFVHLIFFFCDCMISLSVCTMISKKYKWRQDNNLAALLRSSHYCKSSYLWGKTVHFWLLEVPKWLENGSMGMKYIWPKHVRCMGMYWMILVVIWASLQFSPSKPQLWVILRWSLWMPNAAYLGVRLTFAVAKSFLCHPKYVFQAPNQSCWWTESNRGICFKN